MSRARIESAAPIDSEISSAIARRPRCGVVVEQRYLAQAQPAGMIDALNALGHDVVTIDPDAASPHVGDGAWLDEIDLVACRGRSFALFCMLTAAEHRGVPTINRRGAIAAVHNKAEMAVALAAAGVPTPKTFLGSPRDLAAHVSGACYPLILKPSFGDNCQGLVIVTRADELAALAWPEPLVLAQRYLSSDGHDLKLYVIGDQVWAVRKPSPLGGSRNGAMSDCELIPCTADLRALGRRCGALFGLELYGVDCLETPDGPVVIEVNDFPNYTGVPEADGRLAEYVVSRSRPAP